MGFGNICVENLVDRYASFPFKYAALPFSMQSDKEATSLRARLRRPSAVF